MLLNQVISKPNPVYSVIAERCSQYISESQGFPLLKNLPVVYTDVHKVKARKRNVNGEFADTFNEAFSHCFEAITQRAVFANGAASFIARSDEMEPFYVFPINEYKYLYSSEVDNSSEDYKQVLDVMFEQFGSEKGKTIVSEVLKFTYEHDNLVEGISKGSEIVFYDIPYYYAIRTSIVTEYTDLLMAIAQSR